jgi:hypothetical protein
VKITWPDSFATTVKDLQRDAADRDHVIPRKRLAALQALMQAIHELSTKPEAESATFKRVRQARRHELWRVAHQYDPDVAVRIIIWFRCGAYADESCTTPKGNATDPHEARINRAIKRYVAARDRRGN